MTRSINGRVLVKDLSDGFVDSPEQKYPMGMLVKALVKEFGVKDSINHPQYQLSLRSSDVDGDRKAAVLATLSVGQVISGTIQKVTEYGVFVSLDGLDVVGLCKTIDAVNRNQQLHEVYSQGDTVRAKVLKITGPKLTLGLKENYFQGNDSDSGTDSELDHSEVHNMEFPEGDNDGILEEVSDSDDGSLEVLIRNARVPIDIEDEDHDSMEVYQHTNDDDYGREADDAILRNKRKAVDKHSSTAQNAKTPRLISSDVEVLQWDDFQPAEVKALDKVQVPLLNLYQVSKR